VVGADLRWTVCVLHHGKRYADSRHAAALTADTDLLMNSSGTDQALSSSILCLIAGLCITFHSVLVGGLHAAAIPDGGDAPSAGAAAAVEASCSGWSGGAPCPCCKDFR